MHFLIAPTGSHGDVLPFIGIGKRLSERGHTVEIVANELFGPMVEAAGLTFVRHGSTAEYEAVLRDPDMTHPRRGFRRIAQMIGATTPETYRLLESRAQPDTVIVGSTLSFAARFVAERHALPVVIAHLAPALVRSVSKVPRVMPLDAPPLPPVVTRGLWRVSDRFFIDPALGPALNRFRNEIGLPAVDRWFHDWMHQSDLTLGLFPEWFAPRQPDWPASLCVTDFPLFDDPASSALSADIARFLEAGDPPVVVTSGTATAASAPFFREAAFGCARAGHRAVLVTRFPDQLPDPMPDGMCHADYVPFSAILPRASAFIHHGGIGSTSQALRAGVPQLIRPMAFDQFDNSARCQRLGVSRELLPARFTSRSIAPVLDALVDDDNTTDACERVSRLFKADALTETVEAIEHLSAMRG